MSSCNGSGCFSPAAPLAAVEKRLPAHSQRRTAAKASEEVSFPRISSTYPETRSCEASELVPFTTIGNQRRDRRQKWPGTEPGRPGSPQVAPGKRGRLCAASVVVMQAAEVRDGKDAACGRRFDDTRLRRVVDRKWLPIQSPHGTGYSG
jgi:hypothetical protein